MAVTYTQPKPNPRSGAVNARWERNYSVIYRARTDHPRVGANAVLAACPVAIGDTYAAGAVGPPDTTEADTGSYCNNIAATNDSDDALNWTVTVDYGPTEPLDENPLDRKPTVDWDFLTEDGIVDVDQDGLAVVNAAYDSFDPPLVRGRHPAILVVTRNEAQFLYSWVADLTDATNDADFIYVGDLGKWLIAKITSSNNEATLSNGTVVTFWPVRYELHFRPEGWGKTILNQGMRQLTVAGTAWEPILVNGQPISSPSLLDATGRALAAAGTPTYLDFRIYREVDFTILNFTGIDLGEGPLP